MRSWKFDQDKFDHLVHYVISTCPDRDKLGSVKLQKILWKADTENYMLKGEPITGARYLKRPYGPATNELWPSRERLKASGQIDFWRDTKFAGDYPKDAYKALKPIPSNFLTSEQQKIVDRWINVICLEHTANSISEETHGYAWDIAAMGEELPMEAALVDRGREPEGEELEQAKKRARELGLI
jgi:antitoxin SocA-like protein